MSTQSTGSRFGTASRRSTRLATRTGESGTFTSSTRQGTSWRSRLPSGTGRRNAPPHARPTREQSCLRAAAPQSLAVQYQRRLALAPPPARRLASAERAAPGLRASSSPTTPSAILDAEHSPHIFNRIPTPSCCVCWSQPPHRRTLCAVARSALSCAPRCRTPCAVARSLSPPLSSARRRARQRAAGHVPAQPLIKQSGAERQLLPQLHR